MNVFGSMAMNVFLNVVMILGIEAESILMFKTLVSFEKLPKCLYAVHEINCSCERWSTKLKTSAAVEDGAQSQHPQDDLLLLKKHKIVEETHLD